VNALAAGQSLTFGESGMTIVYGENGSGKSGYVRILKSACRARLEKSFTVYPNIYGTTADSPISATVAYTEGTTNHCPKWTKGAPTPQALSAISVFDSNSGAIHVTGTNSVAYTPFPLLVLAGLAKVATKLGQKLTEEVSQLEGAISPTVKIPENSRRTAAVVLIANLSGSTAPEAVTALATLSEDEKAELLKLRSDFGHDPAALATRNIKLAQRLDNLAEIFQTIDEKLTTAQVADLFRLRENCALKKAAAMKEAQRLFSDVPLPVGSDTWLKLWEAARSYSNAEGYPDKHFPHTTEEAACVLCQEPMKELTRARLRRFEQFADDELGNQVRAAQKQLDDATNFPEQGYLKPSKISEIRHFLDNVGQESLSRSITSFLIRAAWRQRWVLRSNYTVAATEAPAMKASPGAEITAGAESLRNVAKALHGEIVSPERMVLQTRFDELSDREWLSVIKDDVLKAIAIRAQIEKIQAVLPHTATGKITTKSTALAKDLVTDRLRDRFANEVSILGISRLRVELRQETSQAGVPRFKVCFVAKPKESVGIVLSEGEQNCLAIAAFLAELETADDTSGIVLDDPITSLDHQFRDRVASRLATEALKRQVVIFTHDIPFLSQLQNACRTAKLAPQVRMISRGGDTPGYCHSEAPATHRPVADSIEAARKNFANKRFLFDRGDPVCEELVTAFGGTLRKLWERAVEELISPVLTRWSHKIDTAGFGKLTAITLTDHAVMRAGYGQCSIWEHFQPAAANSPMPTAEDIEAEIKRIGDWYAGIKLRQDAIK